MQISVPKDLNSFSVVPGGIYRVAVTGYKYKTAQSSGNQMISVEYTIQSPGPDDNQKTIGRKVFDNLVMSEAALGVVNSKYKALTGKDLPAGDFEIEEFMNMITSNIMNREAVAEITVNAGTNGERNNVKKLTAIQS